jgi:hypothetical protein
MVDNRISVRPSGVSARVEKLKEIALDTVVAGAAGVFVTAVRVGMPKADLPEAVANAASAVPYAPESIIAAGALILGGTARERLPGCVAIGILAARKAEAMLSPDGTLATSASASMHGDPCSPDYWKKSGDQIHDESYRSYGQ